jgi:NAD(P)-dependent dehydrogenase (short-subunit alcohol dehydrogenase family)
LIQSVSLKQSTFYPNHQFKTMAAKTIVVITGGNAGLGLEVVKALYGKSSHPYHIFMGSRSVDKAHEAIANLRNEYAQSNSEVEALQIDIENDDSIQHAFDSTSSKVDHVDVLINNAGKALSNYTKLINFPCTVLAETDHSILGGQFDNTMDTSTTAGIRAMWNRSYNVNVASTQVVTYTFMPLLLKSTNPRLMFVTSGLSTLNGTATKFEGQGNAARLAESPPKGWPKPVDFAQPAYRSSKSALNMLMLDWHRKLQHDGAKVWSISPGFLATGLGSGNGEQMKKLGALDPSVGGEFIQSVVEGARDGDVGKVILSSGIQPW